ncbi:prolyl oligopeptidase family serine peptidase [Pseudoduganella ginsengisoli]|uniref:Prolyl oligopeptidase family serine peptidase n=1 Tax=Pseudoduganella ginsengisoli TaxID=1462440 RepID=A0A6L6PV72_9BURK|nr:prolyl oligopeptidase family serine peptidase [Pseudoduganella ginsengisoli]MTW01387.1 prolyl oligopeptidase family serine peptidase [Pseudoduganella ginsengisoli]
MLINSELDPYLWLEDVGGDAPLDWVQRQAAIAEGELKRHPEFDTIHGRLRTILNSQERIPYVTVHGGWYYNFWRDASHVRGIWRRTTPQQYGSADPAWETMIDLDVLANVEDENWVWSGVVFLHHGDRCLVSLSRGGGDAHVLREYDLDAKAFVSGGFMLPEAKSQAAWRDRDSIFVATDCGPGTLTQSGYPRTVREWRRGAALLDSPVLFEAAVDDLGAGACMDFTPGHRHEFIWRSMTFYTNELYLREGPVLTRIAKPDDANAYTVRGQLIIELRSAWETGGAVYPQGALLATDFRAFLRGERQMAVLFEPSPTTSLDGVCVTRSTLLLNILDNVKNRLVELTHGAHGWRARNVDVPAFGSLEASPLDAIDSDEYFLTVTDFLTPTTLALCRAGSDERTVLRRLPAYFDAEPYEVRQFSARSRDGTQVPYFAVLPRHACGPLPALLYGYGGFEVSLKPYYSGATGAGWLEHGGIYLLANIRGGGEFGPRWHQAALKENRQNAYDDFIAVAEDAIARGLTSAGHLGIMGGSNGGLLVGAVMAQRPELFNAVVCQVPLLDMRRYHQLLAGASWVGEYGDPDDPAQWAYIARYSPYHNVSAQRAYPRMLLTTSTRDDRVHPGHARKMAALMLEQGHDVLYWENTEGGHAGAANNDQQALMWALTYAFLLQQLKY